MEEREIEREKCGNRIEIGKRERQGEGERERKRE